jgi:processive 1,2-diacylglycerol beta-glucosyltransferase
VHGLTAPEFLDPHDQPATRASLGLPLDGKIVLVSGGGWGVGDVEGAIEDALAVDEVVQVVCLCGRNEELRDRLHTRFADNTRVRVEGFTNRMADWMAAADVLVHSTGGLTVLESLMLGLPAISYGWGRGHVRVNNAAFRRFGLATVAGSRAELAPALRNALAGGRLPVDGFRDLPSAASVVLGAVNGRAAVADRTVS